MTTVGVINSRDTQILLNGGILLYKGREITPPDNGTIYYQINPRTLISLDQSQNHRVRVG